MLLARDNLKKKVGLFYFWTPGYNVHEQPNKDLAELQANRRPAKSFRMPCH